MSEPARYVISGREVSLEVYQLWISALLAERDRRVAKGQRLKRYFEERATGRRRFRSGAHALGWYFATRLAWMSRPGLPIDPEREGTGAPNRGADDPKRRAFAAIAKAIGAAEADDRDRNPTDPAPLFVWLGEHFTDGRAYAWIAEECGRGEQEVAGRVERAIRVVAARLREHSWLERGAEEA